MLNIFKSKIRTEVQKLLMLDYSYESLDSKFLELKEKLYFKSSTWDVTLIRKKFGTADSVEVFIFTHDDNCEKELDVNKYENRAFLKLFKKIHADKLKSYTQKQNQLLKKIMKM